MFKITESDIRKMVTESVRSLLKESTPFARNVPQHIRDKYIKKIASENPELDPKGFFYNSNGDLMHNGKKRLKKVTKTEKLPSREVSGLDSLEYLKQIVLKNDKNLENEMEKNGEKWINLTYNALRGNSIDADYSNDYYISNFGRILIVNANNGKGKITNGYWDSKSSHPQYRINLRTYGVDGVELSHNTPSVAKLVAIAFLGAYGKFKLKFKDGDASHPYANNLEVYNIK